MPNDTDDQFPMPVTVTVHRPEVKAVRALPGAGSSVCVVLGRLDGRVDHNFADLIMASSDALEQFVLAVINAAEREFPGFAEAVATDLRENVLDRPLIRSEGLQ